jgi:hypothetical protein
MSELNNNEQQSKSKNKPSNKTNRNRQVHLVVTDEEFEKLQTLSKDFKNISDYIRHSTFLSRNEMINYLNKVADLNDRVKNKQFHAILSAKGQEHSAEELKVLAEEYIRRMGYADNPYLIYSHKDTDNNHVHIVSTHVNTEGVRIDDAFEKKRSLNIINQIMQSIPRQKMTGEYIKNNVLPYKFSTRAQLELIIENQGYMYKLDAERNISVYKNDKLVTSIPLIDIEKQLKKPKNEQRIRQLKAFFEKYRHNFDKDGFEAFMKEKFGIELFFHKSSGKDLPYGYTIIDHAAKEVFKGSEVMKLSDILKLSKETAAKNIPLTHKEAIENTGKDAKRLQNYLDKNDLFIIEKQGQYFLIDRKMDNVENISNWKNIKQYEGTFNLDGMEIIQEKSRSLDITIPISGGEESGETDRKRKRSISR